MLFEPKISIIRYFGHWSLLIQIKAGKCDLTTVVGDNINIMKTTFELDFYQAFKQHGYTQKYENKEKLSI